MIEEYINIHKKTLNGNAVLFEVYSKFFEGESSYIIKYNEETAKLSFERVSLDYRGKSYDGTRSSNAMKFSFPSKLNYGRFEKCEEESDEDLLVFYLEDSE